MGWRTTLKSKLPYIVKYLTCVCTTQYINIRLWKSKFYNLSTTCELKRFIIFFDLDFPLLEKLTKSNKIRVHKFGTKWNGFYKLKIALLLLISHFLSFIFKFLISHYILESLFQNYINIYIFFIFNKLTHIIIYYDLIINLKK